MCHTHYSLCGKVVSHACFTNKRDRIRGPDDDLFGSALRSMNIVWYVNTQLTEVVLVGRGVGLGVGTCIQSSMCTSVCDTHAFMYPFSSAIFSRILRLICQAYQLGNPWEEITTWLAWLVSSVPRDSSDAWWSGSHRGLMYPRIWSWESWVYHSKQMQIVRLALE
jgi:hypothetical protein